MQNLMAQAQRMQRDIMKKKEEVEKKEFTGKSELVTVIVNGKKDLVKVEFAKEVASDDLDALLDMIVIATNNANKEVDAAMEAAAKAFKTWSKVPYAERQQALNKFADAIDAHAEDFAKLLTQEQGKPVSLGS